MRILAGTLILYVVLLFLQPNTAIKSLVYALNLFLRLIPAFLLVIIFNIILNRFSLPNVSKTRRGYLYAAVGGAISSGPIYAWYPLLKNLKDRNIFNYGQIATFLYARAVKIPLMPVMSAFFGLKITILFNLLLFLLSPLVGYLVHLLMEVVE